MAISSPPIDKAGPPTRAALRAMLLEVFADDIGLHALIIDHFPEVRPYVAASMGPMEIINALLVHVEPEAIWAVVKSAARLASRLAKTRPPPDNAAPAPTIPPRLCAPGAAYDPTTYVSRLDEEQQALDRLASRGAAVVLKAPERLGKTWLLERILESVREAGSVVRIDMKEFQGSPARESLAEFLRLFAAQFLDQVGVAGTDSPEAQQLLDSAFGRSLRTPVASLAHLMKGQVLPTVPRGKWLMVALDSADALFGSAVQEDFFTMLRVWMGYTTQPTWAPLRLLLTLSTAPHLYIKNIHKSPFSAAETITLSDFTAEQIGLLAGRYGLIWPLIDCQAFLQSIGGHPFLVHMGLDLARRKQRGPAELVLQRGQMYAAYLDQCVRRLHGELNLAGQLRRALLAPRARLPLEDETRLIDAGFLVHESGQYLPRQPLYSMLVERLG